MQFLTLGQIRRLIKEELFREYHENDEPISADSAKELLKRYPKGMQRLGISLQKIDSLPILGTGTRGTAFDLGDNRVLKITNDSDEAEAAAILVGQNIPNVCIFYGVWKLGESHYYAILQEKLKPLSSSAAKEFDDALVATGLPVWAKRADGSWDSVKQMSTEFVLKQIKKHFRDNYNSPKAQQYAKSINDKWNLLIKKYGIRTLFQTLTNLGIDFHDYHAGNMMTRDDGTLVLIDLGMSNVRKKSNIQTMTQDAGH